MGREKSENRFNRHRKLTTLIQDWATSNGFELFAQKGFESQTVTTITNSRNIDVAEFVKRSINKGYRFVNGYGDLKGKTFRIAAMGWQTEETVTEFLGVLTEILNEL